jgi:type VI secretion system secreted protein VgrG
VALPRIGTEVLVNFLGGDPDKPVIVGQLYNEVAEPAALSSLGSLEGNRYLSGMKSREIHGTRGNQLYMDDTQGQLSAHLSSDHGDTQLNLGFLTTPRSEGAGEARGEGAELSSKEQIALRAARGMLLSAWEHVGSSSKQMDRKEFQLLMMECMDLAKSLGELASKNNAKPSNSKGQQQLCEAFESWESGSNTEPAAAKSEKPMIAMTSPAGISIVTANDLISYAATNQSLIAQQNLQLTSGQSGVINAGKGISLFSQSEGIDVIAHKGRLLLQSQQDNTEFNAAKDLKFTATEGKIIGMAKEIILVAENGSFIKIGDGITLGTKGTITHRGASFPFKGPSSMVASLPKFEHDPAEIKFQAKYYPNIDGGIPVPDVTVVSTVADGEEHAERSNQEGRTELIARDAMLMVSAVAMRNKEE